MSDTREYELSMKPKVKPSEPHDAARAANIYWQIMQLSTDTEFPIFSIEVEAVKAFAEERLAILFANTIEKN